VVGPVAAGPRGFVGAAYYYELDHGRVHSASWGGLLLPVMARHVGEAAAWTGREVRVVLRAQVGT